MFKLRGLTAEAVSAGYICMVLSAYKNLTEIWLRRLATAAGMLR